MYSVFLIFLKKYNESLFIYEMYNFIVYAKKLENADKLTNLFEVIRIIWYNS